MTGNIGLWPQCQEALQNGPASWSMQPLLLAQWARSQQYPPCSELPSESDVAGSTAQEVSRRTQTKIWIDLAWCAHLFQLHNYLCPNSARPGSKIGAPLNSSRKQPNSPQQFSSAMPSPASLSNSQVGKTYFHHLSSSSEWSESILPQNSAGQAFLSPPAEWQSSAPPSKPLRPAPGAEHRQSPGQPRGANKHRGGEGRHPPVVAGAPSQ